MITRLIDQLNRTDLRPGPEVNTLFGELVTLASAAGKHHPTIADPQGLAEVRRICALGEANLEDHWSTEVLTDPTRLADFPYRDNYRALAQAEYDTLTHAVGRPLRHLVFAGCGPLPLTALELHSIDPELRITCLDIDPVVAQRARDVIEALAGPGHRVRVVCADAAAHRYDDADAVVIAALIGATAAEKLQLLEQIVSTLSPDVVVAARSVPEDGRQLLYPRIDPGCAASTARVLGEWVPPAGVINSLLLLRSTGPALSLEGASGTTTARR